MGSFCLNTHLLPPQKLIRYSFFKPFYAHEKRSKRYFSFATARISNKHKRCVSLFSYFYWKLSEPDWCFVWLAFFSSLRERIGHGIVCFHNLCARAFFSAKILKLMVQYNYIYHRKYIYVHQCHTHTHLTFYKKTKMQNIHFIGHLLYYLTQKSQPEKERARKCMKLLSVTRRHHRRIAPSRVYWKLSENINKKKWLHEIWLNFVSSPLLFPIVLRLRIVCMSLK